MDEGRDQDPAAQPVGAGRLSPVQTAYGDWTRHCLGCATCRDIDAGRCGTADRLWRAYEEATKQAYRQLATET